MDTYELARLRGDIALLARTPNKAREIVQTLTETDWEYVIGEQDEPHVECLICKNLYLPGHYDILSCHFNMCHDCREKRGWDNRKTLNKENRKFHFNLERARVKGLPATLTLFIVEVQREETSFLFVALVTSTKGGNFPVKSLDSLKMLYSVYIPTSSNFPES